MQAGHTLGQRIRSEEGPWLRNPTISLSSAAAPAGWCWPRKLGNRLGRRGRARITLIDNALTHIWKPLLHEVAVGTMGPHNDDVNYLGHARDHHFAFQPGRMDGLDRAKRLVHLGSILDPEGEEVTPAREIAYDTLVIAVGSTSNDFAIPGVAEYCLYLDSYQQADRFQQRLLSICMRAQFEPDRPARQGAPHRHRRRRGDRRRALGGDA